VLPEAEAAFLEAAMIFRDLGDPLSLGFALHGLASVAGRRGDVDSALLLASYADLLYERAQFERPLEMRLAEQRWIEPIRQIADPAALRRAREAAAAADLAEILEAAAHAAPSAHGDGNVVLSHRELEVVSLLAVGRSNRQIAEALGVSQRTVDAHLDHVRNKLGLRTRVQIARWVLGHRPQD
jgi:DNA-binding CsgD family transcriptional regulator